MRPLMPDINMISAPVVLKQKGTPLTESKRDVSPVFDSLVRLKVHTGGGWLTVAGSTIAGSPKLVEARGMPLEAEFHPITLFVDNLDRPGFVGSLGTILGNGGINIASFHFGRQTIGGDAIAIVGVDQVVPEDVQQKLRELPHVRFVKVLQF
jgi:D-3-phosphoglycerate dehydrogenase